MDVLKNFYEMSDGHCSLVEVEYSMVVPEAEQNGFLDYCREKNLGVLIRGPLAQGIVRGIYLKETVFTDSVRANYNVGGRYRKQYEERIDMMERIKAEFGTENLAELALRYVISHETRPTAIPGATTPEQVIKNIETSEKLLDAETLKKIRELRKRDA